MPVVTLDWENAHRHGDLWIEQHRLRHRIFIERLGWNVSEHNGLEYDSFDTPAAKYLVWVDDDGDAKGIMRLVPTTAPYMIETLWPDWATTPRLPHSREIWEATRFGCDHGLRRLERQRVILELIAESMRFGTANRISAYLVVTSIWIFERVLAAAGCQLTMLAPARMIDGELAGIAEVEVSPRVLAAVEAKLSPAFSRPNGTSIHYFAVA